MITKWLAASRKICSQTEMTLSYFHQNKWNPYSVYHNRYIYTTEIPRTCYKTWNINPYQDHYCNTTPTPMTQKQWKQTQLSFPRVVGNRNAPELNSNHHNALYHEIFPKARSSHNVNQNITIENHINKTNDNHHKIQKCKLYKMARNSGVTINGSNANICNQNGKSNTACNHNIYFTNKNISNSKQQDVNHRKSVPIKHHVEYLVTNISTIEFLNRIQRARLLTDNNNGKH